MSVKYNIVKLFLLLLSLSAHAREIEPTFKFKTSGFVSDFVFDAHYLYVATDVGVVDVFDIKSQSIVNQITLPLIHSGLGDKIKTKIHSIDIYKDKLLFISSGVKGFRNVWLFQDNQLKQIVDETQEMSIKEARFVDDEKIIFGTFASESILFDYGENYKHYTKQISGGNQGDITLSRDHTKLLASDEGGEVYLMDVKSSKLLHTYSGQNVDKVFHIAYEHETLITAGQDRRVGVYSENEKPYYIKSGFFVYCVGLSPSAKTGVYLADEENNLQLFNIHTKKKGDLLVGHKSLVNQIKFITEKGLLSSAREELVYYWRLD